MNEMPHSLKRSMKIIHPGAKTNKVFSNEKEEYKLEIESSKIIYLDDKGELRLQLNPILAKGLILECRALSFI